MNRAEITSDFSTLVLDAGLSHQTYGNLYEMLPIRPKPPTQTYRYFLPPETAAVKKEQEQIKISNPNGSPHRVYVIHDSFGMPLQVLLAYLFSESIMMRFNHSSKRDMHIHFKELEQDILDFKTDILILEISELKIIEMPRLL